MKRSIKKSKEHAGGRIAANPRRANIAEGFDLQMLRPFAAVAPVPREEDFGIDVIATLLRRTGKALTASDSFFVQVKTRTSATFRFVGDGIEWVRSLRLPYFPLVVNLDKAIASIYTLNRHRKTIQLARLQKLDFVTDEVDTGFDTFPLGQPLMTWSLVDCTHEGFPTWALSVLQPAVKIEMLTVNYGRYSGFFGLVGHSYRFRDRAKETVMLPPQIGKVWDYVPTDIPQMLTSLKHAMGPFAYAISNMLGMENKGDELLTIRRLMRGLGVDPDPNSEWDTIAREMDDD